MDNLFERRTNLQRINFKLPAEDHRYLRGICYEHGSFQAVFSVLFGWLVRECRERGVRIGQTAKLEAILRERFPEMYALGQFSEQDKP